MKVLFIGNDASRTGAPIGLLHLLRWLKTTSDIEFDLLLRVGGGPLTADYEKLCKVTAYSDLICDRGPIRRLARRVGCATLGGQSCLSPLERIYGERGIDLVYANTITNGGILSDLASLDCPVICHVHELESVIRTYGGRNLANVKKYASTFIADSRATAENLTCKHGFPVESTHVAYEWIPVVETSAASDASRDIRQELGIDEGAFVVGGSGYKFWRKGKDLFVRTAVAVARMTAAPVAFVWVGGDEDDEDVWALENLIKDAGVADMMHVVPHVSNPQAYYAVFDLFALTSREEPLGMVMLEAACFGVPSLCFEGCGGAPEFVESDAGFVVPHLDVDAMAEKIVLLMQDDALRRQLGAQAREKVRNRHDVPVVAPKVLDIINRVGGGELKRS